MRKILIIILSLVLAGAVTLALVYSISGGLWMPTKATTQTTTQESPVIPTAPSTEAPTELSTEPATEPATEPPTEPLLDPPDMGEATAKHAFVYDVDAGRMLFTWGDQHQRIEPASLTKLFTAYVAMQYLEPDAVVVVGEEAGWIAWDSTVAAVDPGCVLTVRMILQGMMMQSGNDAAYALAVAAGRVIANDPYLYARAALDIFLEEMNYQLQELGLSNTHFNSPDGYHDDDHYTTAADLMQIALLAMQEPLIVEYAGVDRTLVTYLSGQQYMWKNTNWLLDEENEYYCPEATGLKTGATSRAGKCVIATFETEQTTLLIGVLGCEDWEDRFAETVLLFEHYR